MSYNPSPQRGAVMGSLRLRHALPAVAAAFVAVLFGSSAAFASTGHTGFGFNAPNISGGSGSVFLTGGGAFDSTSGLRPLRRRLQVHLHGKHWPARRMPGRTGRSLGYRSTPAEHAVQVHRHRSLGGQDRDHHRRHRCVAGRLLPSRRRQQRVIHRQHVRVDRGPRSRCPRRPECLGARRRLWVGRGPLQPLRSPHVGVLARSNGIAVIAGASACDHSLHG